MNIGGDCPFCHKEAEIINYLFKNCVLAYNVRSTINVRCPNPNYTNLHIIDCLEHIWCNGFFVNG